MRYTLLQLFLTSRDEGTMFERLEAAPTRQEYLKTVFGAEVRFSHWRKWLVYKPYPSPDETYVVGVFAKGSTVTVTGPPAAGFAATDVENWDTANVLIDSSEGAQKIAMQSTLGQPLNVFRSFVDHINAANPNAKWAITVNPITEEGQFWAISTNKRCLVPLDARSTSRRFISLGYF